MPEVLKKCLENMSPGQREQVYHYLTNCMQDGTYCKEILQYLEEIGDE